MLARWKERETVYERRRVRIADQFGGIVPAYAVATAGAPVMFTRLAERGRQACGC